ncbi:pupal cuticle protein Edg-91 [Drosophila grimshawi]|uniref:GH19717 n=1 Tax=Drosophila grimshawi TaxID=7222 RepID=B4J4N1_DROGR|nr:pupal cuticle protein Edg-91 [Drosophila grimshawi]EDW02736.1 GH19717 [Drosophila grimshawi]
MPKFLIVCLCLTALIFLLSPTKAAPGETLVTKASEDDLSTADTIGIGYYSPSYYSPYYGGGGYGGYGYGGYGGYGYRYGGYRGYGRSYRRHIYPVWG